MSVVIILLNLDFLPTFSLYPFLTKLIDNLLNLSNLLNLNPEILSKTKSQFQENKP